MKIKPSISARLRSLLHFAGAIAPALISVLVVPFTVAAQNLRLPEGFTPLFNGKDLTGWHRSLTTHHGTSGNFYVEDSAIVLKQHPFGQGGLLLTNEKFQDFELYLEFKGHPGTNGGIFFRSAESGTAYQLELAGDGDRGTGAWFGEMLHTTTNAPVPDLSEIWKKGDWNSFRLRVEGDVPHVKLWINDKLLWEAAAARNDLIADAAEGMIALQLHWSATALPVPGGSCCGYSWKPDASHRFRNIGIKILTPHK